MTGAGDNVDVLGADYPVAHYKAHHESFNGFNFPTRQRVVPRNPDNTTRPGPVIVTIDIDSVTVT